MAIDPMTMLSIGQSAIGFVQESRKQAELEQRYQQNRLAAAASRDLKIQQLNRRAIQEAEATAGQKFDLAIRALETRERRVVTAGEAGVRGQGIDAQLDMTEARKLRGDTVFNQQLENVFAELELNKMGADAEAMNRINSLQRGVQPSFMTAAVGAAAGAYATELKYGGNKSGSFLDSMGLGGNVSPYGQTDVVLPNVSTMS
jgi:hypothetical protein